MTESLQIGLIVRATPATPYDVIDIGRCYHLGQVDTKGVNAQGVGCQEHSPLLSPACTIAALRCGLSHIIRAQILRMTDGACLTACHDYARTSEITTLL